MKRLFVTFVSCLVLLSATVTTPALAEAKEKMGDLDFTPLTSALSATQDKFVSSIISDMNEHCALPPETNADYTAFSTNNSDSASATDTTSVPESTTIDSHSKTLSTDRNSLAYVVKSGTGENITLTFQYGAQPSSSDWWKIADTYTTSPRWAWSQATTVTFDESFKNYTPTSTAYWFDHLSSLKTINNIENLNTTYVTNMSYMFSSCYALTSLALPAAFDTSNVEDMRFMFSYCTSLTSLTLPIAFDTSNVAKMTSMFYKCSALTSLTLPAAFDTSKVTGMSNMFFDCSALKTLTLGKKTQLKTGTSLPGLTNSTNPFWIKDIQTAVSYNTTDADAVANINAILSGLSDTETQTFTKATMRLTYNANGGEFPEDPEPATPVTEAYLYGNPGDKISDSSATPAFNYTPVPQRENYNYSGYAASATATTATTPTEFPAEGSNTTFYAVWSQGAYVVKSGTGRNRTLTFQYGAQPSSGTQGTDWWPIEDTYTANPGWHSSGATTVTFDESFENYTPTSTAYWFSNLTYVTTIKNISYLNTTNVTDMTRMFSKCSALTSLTLPTSFDTSSVEYMSYMFYYCSALTSLTLPDTFNTSRVKNMNNMFRNCSALTSLALPAAFDTSSVKYMHFMFYYCSALTSLNLPAAFDTSNVGSMMSMFYNCSALTSLTLPDTFNTHSVTDMNSMFSDCSKLTSLTLPAAFDTSSVTDMRNMFSSCSKLTSLTLPAAFDTSSVEYMYEMFSGCSALTSITLPKDFVFRNGTAFPFGGTATGNFWIPNKTTRMEGTYDKWNSYLAGLPDTTTVQTFHIANRTYTFDANGGAFGTGDEASSSLSFYGNEGDALGSAPTPQRTGYDQNGWWTEAEEGTQVTIPSVFGADPEVSVYAHWNKVACTVVFDANGLTFIDGATQKTLTLDYGEDLVAPELSIPEGVAFEGWFSAPEGGDPMPSDCTQDATYYAHSTTPAPGPTPTPEPSDGDSLIPLTGDSLSGNFMAIFLASIVSAGMALLLSCRLSRKGESE